MNMKFNFNNPTNLLFGSGSLNELGTQVMPGKRQWCLFQMVNQQKRMDILTAL